MKKAIIIGLAALLLVGASAQAAPDTFDFSATLIGETAKTNTVVIRGTLEGVFVDVGAGGTCTVSVVSEQATLFSKAGIVADTLFTPFRVVQTSAGVSATNISGQIFYTPQIMAGPVVVTITSQNATTTNSFNASVIYNP
jgi:hypothetical protein